MVTQLAAAATAFTLLLSSASGYVGEIPRITDYSYTYYADAVAAPASYEFEQELTAEHYGLEHFAALEDMDTAADGTVYLVDSGTNRVIQLDSDYGLKNVVTSFEWEGMTHTFAEPKGISCGNNGCIYVADTKNHRVVVLDEDLKCVDIIGAPALDDAQYDYEYLPAKVEADRDGRVYVVGENQTQGIFRFNNDGAFMGYFGATKVQTTAQELFYRIFASESQLEGMLKFIPTEYSNITLDEDDFVYGTIATVKMWDVLSDIRGRTSSVNPVRRLNQNGVNILVTGGTHPVVGELSFNTGSGSYDGNSILVDVAVYEDGVYSVLDSKRGRVFTYDDQGNLMYVFGGRGSEKGMFTTPTALMYKGDHLLVADKATGSVQVFAPTQYAKKILEGVSLYHDGRYEEEAVIWQEILEMYPGCSIANSGLGRAYYNSGDFSLAMQYFRLANDRTNYSDALKGVIRERGIRMLPWICGALAILTIVFLVLRKVWKKKERTVRETRWTKLWSEVKYAGYVCTHPFDAFWDLKYEKRGSAAAATVLLLAAIVVNVAQIRLMPFLFNTGNFLEESALVSGFVGVAALILLWVCANWALTTLMNGKGSFKDIYTYTCYSLTPMILLYPLIIVVSYFMYEGSASFLNMLTIVATAWVIMLLFVGTCVTHHYSAGKTVLTIILTVVGMLIIVFLAFLVLTLFQQMLTFAQMVIKEIQLSL